jgi:hypothetical protein
MTRAEAVGRGPLEVHLRGLSNCRRWLTDRCGFSPAGDTNNKKGGRSRETGRPYFLTLKTPSEMTRGLKSYHREADDRPRDGEHPLDNSTLPAQH